MDSLYLCGEPKLLGSAVGLAPRLHMDIMNPPILLMIILSSHLPGAPMMVFRTGRWAHFNVKLLFFSFHQNEKIRFAQEFLSNFDQL